MATPEAVIEIGSTGVRLLVAEYNTSDRIRTTLDRAELPVSLGKDVFSTGSISRESQTQCVQILQRFKECLKSWAIAPEQTVVIATAAFREAKNKDSVLDKIFISTGFRVKVIDGIEENRLMYIAVKECLKEQNSALHEDTIILEVGGGSTELMFMKKGKMAGAHSLRLGTVRLESKVRNQAESLSEVKRYIEEFTTNTKGSFETEMNLSQITQMIAIGNDATLAAINVGKPISTFLWSIEREAFESFVDEIQEYSIDECTARFKLSYHDAMTLHVSLLIYKMFIQLSDIKTIIVPETNIRDGIIISRTNVPNEDLHSEFNQQITASATSLLRKYHGDEEHAERVREYSTKLYNFMKDEISLDERCHLLLEVASILHDIGNFIHMEDHNLHSEYIIRNSEIFGITHTENIILSTIACYHRGKQQPQDNESFQILSRSDRLTILKLTAILRVCDALDRSHGKSFTDFSLRKHNDSLIIETNGNTNVALERIALSEKGELFESVFGYNLILL